MRVCLSGIVIFDHPLVGLQSCRASLTITNPSIFSHNSPRTALHWAARLSTLWNEGTKLIWIFLFLEKKVKSWLAEYLLELSAIALDPRRQSKQKLWKYGRMALQISRWSWNVEIFGQNECSLLFGLRTAFGYVWINRLGFHNINVEWFTTDNSMLYGFGHRFDCLFGEGVDFVLGYLRGEFFIQNTIRWETIECLLRLLTKEVNTRCSKLLKFGYSIAAKGSNRRCCLGVDFPQNLFSHKSLIRCLICL